MSAHGSGDHMTRTPALSVHPHMAWLIVHGFKPVENRNWRTQHRGPLLIHASTWPCEAPAILLPDLEARYGICVPKYPDEWPTGELLVRAVEGAGGAADFLQGTAGLDGHGFSLRGGVAGCRHRCRA